VAALRGVRGATARLRTPTRGGSFLAYAAVVDNRSGDPVYVPGVRLRPAVEGVLTLSHRHDAVAVGGWSQAAGVAALPAGASLLSVDGSGDLGSDGLPLLAVCLYADEAGDRRAEALAPGERRSGLGGGPLWCFIPDRGDLDDNSGGLTVRVDGGTAPTVLELDARDNAVLVDRLPQARLAAARGGSWSVTAVGDLGGGDRPAHTLVVVAGPGAAGAGVTVVADGARAGPVAAGSTMLAIVLDAEDTADNTGWTVLRAE
jgi:hypothetical protein